MAIAPTTSVVSPWKPFVLLRGTDTWSVACYMLRRKTLGLLASSVEIRLDQQLNTRKWYEPQMLWRKFVCLFFRDVMVDVVAEQSHSNEPKRLQNLPVEKSLADKHARVGRYDPKVEHLYSFLQVLTAATASFAHGANDVADAMGALSAIYHIWNTGTTGEDSLVPPWLLVFGRASISIGLWTYEYNLMRNLGKCIILHSPCRGLSMELGAAVTVVLATHLALPLSTTQCIIGAAVGVGLCAETSRL